MLQAVPRRRTDVLGTVRAVPARERVVDTTALGRQPLPISDELQQRLSPLHRAVEIGIALDQGRTRAQFERPAGGEGAEQLPNSTGAYPVPPPPLDQPFGVVWKPLVGGDETTEMGE